jgi:hypothetical protein
MDLVHSLQAASIALGAFVCLWGLWEFGHCLWEVLIGKHNGPTYSQCPGHATMAVVCITGLVFCSARANTIGLIRMGDLFSGLAFVGGMFVFCFIVALAIWAKARTHSIQRPHPIHIPSLSWIFSMMLIIILSFSLVGLVGVYYR